MFNFGKRSLIGGFYDLFALEIQNTTNNSFDVYFNDPELNSTLRVDIKFLKIYGFRKFDCSNGIKKILCYF